MTDQELTYHVKSIAYDLIAELEQDVRYETSVIMGIIEVDLAGGARCAITNLATHSMVDMLESRTQGRSKQFLSQLPNREKVQWVCMDMGQPLKHLLAEQLPYATLVGDEFRAPQAASDLPATIIPSYMNEMDTLTKLSSLLGKGYSYEITQAKILYSDEGRKVGSSSIQANGGRAEYGPHIPTLLNQAARGGLD